MCIRDRVGRAQGWPATSMDDPVGAGVMPDLSPTPSTEPPFPLDSRTPKTEREGGNPPRSSEACRRCKATGATHACRDRHTERKTEA
eukprot:11167794-Alexandrium_andersonii.AAC.1